MSDSWNANQFQQGLPSQPGQVKLFDPTKFQTPAAFVGMEQPPKSQQQPQPAGGAQNPPTMQAAGSSWNSWGNWDWNADNTDPTVANQPQSGEQQNAISQHQPSQAGPGGGYQYYGDGDGQYSNAWNQGWDGAGQTYAQPDASGQYDQSQQHQYQYGGMAAQNQFGAYDPNSQQQDHQQQHQQPSQYFDGQHYDPQQQQQQQQPQSDDQSQVYNQFPGHEQFPGQAQAFYDQPYDGGNTWTPTTEAEQWGTGFHPHQQQQNPETSGTENAAGQNQQSGNVQSTDGESIAPPNVNPQASQDNVLTAPSLAVYNHDDDGTVSGFFGRDDDGDVQLTSQKHGQSSFTSGDQGTGDVSSSNQFLGVDPSFHRTNSEISNASLSTLNMSNGDDEDGMEPLHNVQDLVQRMQEVDLSVGQGHSQETNVANLSDNNVPVAPNSSAVADQGQQHRGDYTGFGNTVSDHSAPPPNLPLDTNMRPSSPDINHPSSAESGGSGASGASSGLADWEIVPPQSEQLTHSRNSSLDNSASFFSDKPDGGVSLSAGDGNTVGQGVFPQGSQPPPFSSVSEESVHRNFENMDPSKHSSPRDSSSAASFQEPNPQHHEQNRRSGSPFVAAVTDSSQEESAPKTHKTSPAKSLPGPNLSAPPPSQPTADGTANPFRREGGRSPRHASLPQPTKPDGTGSTAGLGSGDAKTAATPQQSADSQRKGMAALPSKPKVPSGSSTDDGSRLSRRDSDQSIKSTDSSSTRGKQGGEPQVRSSSRNSEEVALSSQQRRHHSAFHPVSRPRQTAMSPATTLWDNTETPTPNILLAPAMPLIIPGLNQYSASTTATSTTGAQGKGATQTAKSDNAGDRSSQRGQTTSEGRDKTEERDRKEDKNRSFDSLDELNPEAESPRDRSHRSQRSDPRESRLGRDPYRRDPDRPPSRYERPSSRNDRGPGQYQYERPSSRTDAYPRDRQRSYYRDYGDSYDERYDRPRSRQDESRGSRPSSRSGQEVDRPRSRNEYDRDRDYYYKDRHRGYAYDSYGKHLDYYNDERERYYRYYKDREARYTRGYYEEYYGTKHAEYYQQYQQQLQQQQQQQQQQQSGRHSRPDYERSSSRSQSRGNTPGPVTSRGNTPAHVSSRGNTPGVPPSPGVAPSPGPDYYNNRGSRPSSRTDYARDYYGRGYAYDGYQAYYDGYGYDPYAYGYGYPGYEDYSQAQDQGRLTPPKYSYPHVRASFGPNGQLVKVLPNRPADGQPAIVEVQDVQSVLESCPEAEELKQFPGPLTRTNTHKKDVLLFCQLKARACAEDINMTDRESAQLIWKFLELLIKQNGSVVGTDLSDLLLEGHEPSTHEYSLHGMRISNSSDALDTVPEGNSEDTGSARGSPAVRITSDRTVINSADREREKWIDRFRHLLLYGRKKDALECAMKNNLWGHALFLASKMDTRTHANVMTRFANSAMRMNDPLQTLYQLMSGRQPAAVTCVGDERWGDWRPHLAMVLSNSTSRHDLDRKSISTLGDTLASKGYLHASHFCYLMAQVNFGSYNKKTSKIVLIGSSHNQLSMEEFATNEAIQCTEVYEYAQVLGNAAFCLPYFQMYKYLYACRLADYGMASEALHYCEVIATNVQQYPTWFQPSFVKLVFQLSSKMKFSDPQRQLTSEDAEDPVWLQQLEKVCSAYDDGTIQPVSGTATPAGFPGTTTSSESGDYNPYAYGYSGDTSAMSGTGVDAYGNVQHQQQAQYGTDYYSNQDPNAVTAQPQAQNVTGTTDPQYQQQGYDQQQQGYDQQQQLQQQQYDYNQWQQQYGYQYAGYGDHYTQPPQQQQQSHNEQHHAAGEDSTEHQQYSQRTTPQHQHQQQQQEGEADGSHQQYQYDGSLTYSNNAAVTPRDVGHDDGARGSAAAVADDKASLGGAPLDASSASSQLSAQLHSQGYDQYGTTTGQQHQQFPPRASISTNETEDEDNVDDDGDDDEDVTDAPTSGFDYFGNVGQQKVVAPPHRFRSMSGSSTGSTRRRRTTSGSSTGSVKAAPHKPAPPPGGPLGSKPGDKKAAPPGKGWFSGLFGKLGAKGKNEMILPDDKNPAIVWDPVKNKWTNADGEEQDEAPAAPPPKDTDLMGKPSAAPPSASMPPPPSVPAGGNRFSLKNKGARNQYVDVNNPKPVAVPQDLFNVMPGTTAPSDGSATTAAPQLFLPGGVPSGDTSANNSASNTNTNNSSLAVPGTDDRLSRSSSVSSFSQEVQQYMAEPAADTSATQAPAAAVQSQQPAAMPMLFNPASLKTNKAGAGHASSAAGPGLKYGQRRAYPK